MAAMAAAAAGGMAVAGSGQVPAMPASSWLGSGTRKSLGALRGFRAASSASSCSGSELRRAPPAQFVRSQENGRGRTRALDTSTAASAAASGTLLSSDGECAIGFLLSLLWAGDFGLCILGFAFWANSRIGLVPRFLGGDWPSFWVGLRFWGGRLSPISEASLTGDANFLVNLLLLTPGFFFAPGIGFSDSFLLGSRLPQWWVS